MIVWKRKYPWEIHWMGKSIVAVHAADHLVWEALFSCFGRGYWIDALPWVDTDVWKD